MASREPPGLTYKDAGVDIEAADRMVERISGTAGRTKIPGVLAGLGGFGALFSLKDALGELNDPVLVSGTDGVGTKLDVAFATGRHDTIGIDLVAMCVNDILTTGAKPLFFLDYFGTGHLEPEVGEKVVAGVAEGCLRSGCALVGGETAELPGMYEPGQYDLAGFAVGVVERDAIIDGKTVAEGQAVIGISSSGLHSNGYSLARKVLLEHAKLPLDGPLEEGGSVSLADAMLEPTVIYAKVIAALLAQSRPHALAHITGGGLPGNVPRVLPEPLCADLKRGSWQIPAIFRRIQELGGVAQAEMEKTFNMGIGLVAVVDDAEAAIAAVQGAGGTAQQIGTIRARANGEPGTVLS